MSHPAILRNTTWLQHAATGLLYAFMIVFSLVVLFPFVHITALSFNQGIDALKGGITIWPRRFTLENYTIIFQDKGLLHAVFISVSRTVVGTLGAVLLTGYVSYCFTKRGMLFYRTYMLIYILPMYIAAGVIPTYLVYRAFGLIDNFLVYIVPNLIWAYNILIMRTYFDGIPATMEESAIIDGADEFTVFFRIILPLSMPVIATIAIYNAVWQWNYWFDTIAFTVKGLDTLVSTLSKMLMEEQSNQINTLRAVRRVKYMTPQVLKAAMTMVTTLPIIIVYPFLQKHFVKGVMIGAVKG